MFRIAMLRPFVGSAILLALAAGAGRIAYDSRAYPPGPTGPAAQTDQAFPPGPTGPANVAGIIIQGAQATPAAAPPVLMAGIIVHE